MGMYNEVYKSCPECGRRCTVQISQITLGFGEFNLDDPQSLAEKLTTAELRELHSAISNEKFYCTDYQDDSEWLGKGCGYNFMLNGQDEKREELARTLFSGNSFKNECPCCGYPNCSHNHGEKDDE